MGAISTVIINRYSTVSHATETEWLRAKGRQKMKREALSRHDYSIKAEEFPIHDMRDKKNALILSLTKPRRQESSRLSKAVFFLPFSGKEQKKGGTALVALQHVHSKALCCRWAEKKSKKEAARLSSPTRKVSQSAIVRPPPADHLQCHHHHYRNRAVVHWTEDKERF